MSVVTEAIVEEVGEAWYTQKDQIAHWRIQNIFMGGANIFVEPAGSLGAAELCKLSRFGRQVVQPKHRVSARIFYRTL